MFSSNMKESNEKKLTFSQLNGLQVEKLLKFVYFAENPTFDSAGKKIKKKKLKKFQQKN